jgi:hypothetical protein
LPYLEHPIEASASELFAVCDKLATEEFLCNVGDVAADGATHDRSFGLLGFAAAVVVGKVDDELFEVVWVEVIENVDVIFGTECIEVFHSFRSVDTL